MILLLAICVVLTTEAYTAFGESRIKSDNPATAEATGIPLDFFDDMEKVLRRHNSKFTYNFEQLRRDQAPQLELREENLGKYMHKHAMTTTTDAIPLAIEEFIEVLNENTKVHGQFKIPITVEELRDNRHKAPEPRPVILALPPSAQRQEVYPAPENWNNWIYQSAYPASMPPPPATPKWEDLREALKHHSHSSKTNQHKLSHHHHQQHHASTSVSSAAHENRKHDYPAPTVALPKMSLVAPNTKPFNNELHLRPEQQPSSRGHIEKVPQHSFRGKHKFSWGDVKEEPTTVLTTTLASVNRNRNPPPAVPTLSPWYDGYGK